MTQKKEKKKPVKKVWWIYNFPKRYDISDVARYCYKTGLIYTKDYVGSSGGEEETAFFQQLHLLNSIAPGVDFLINEGAFNRLKRIAAKPSRTYRGYLLDHKKQPASNGLIATWLGIELDRCKTILKALNDCGLIEKVDLPAFIELPDNPPADGGNGQDSSTNSDIGDSGPAANDPAAISEQSQDDANALRNGERQAQKQTADEESTKPKNLKETANTKCKKEEEMQKTTSCENAEGAENAERQAKGNAQGSSDSSDKQNAVTKVNADAKATVGDPGSNNEASDGQTLDGDPLPIVPTVSEALGVQCDDFVPPPSPDYKPRVAKPSDLHKSFDGLKVIYDPRCRQFALDVFHTLPNLGYCDSPDGRRELGCFAAAWAEAQQAGLPPSVLSVIWDRSIKSAEKIKRDVNRLKIQNPGRLWRYQFNQRLDSKKADALELGKVM